MAFPRDPLELEDGLLEPGGVIVAMRGDLCIGTAGEADLRLRRVLDPGVERLVLDMRNLEFLDSTGISLLLRLEQRSERERFHFGVVLDGGPPSRALELVGLSEKPTRIEPSEVDGWRRALGPAA